jgi:hypothetical protein
VALVAAGLGLASPARAQLGEVHLGAVVAYGAADSHGPGAGIVVGVAAGRITYVGLRWVYHAGRETTAASPTGAVDVRSRGQVFTFDLGVLLPVGAFEVVPGVSVGAVRYTQRARPVAGGGAASSRTHATEFYAAPGLAVHVRVARLLVIPELQYALAGDPAMPWPVTDHGIAASLRIVVPFEVGRIRH